MKKIMISVILLLAILTGLSACSKSGKDSSSPSSSNVETQAPEHEQSVCELLNGMTRVTYQKISLHITTRTGDMELEGRYSLTQSKVTYSVERMNLLPEDGNLDGISPDGKSVLEGTATVENGKITKLDGDAVELPTYEELRGAFDFQEDYFKNVESKSGFFSADVVSASSFLGTNKALKDVRLTVEYGASALEKLVITYQTANTTVTTEYVFEK